MSTWTTYHGKQLEQEAQVLYDHLLHQVQVEPPGKLIERFRKLFIDGTGYPVPEVVAALDKLVAAKTADQEFKFVLNRCCHILINRWQARPQHQPAIPELIDLFDAQVSRPNTEFSRARSIRCLREHVRQFQDTEQYLALRRLAQVMQTTKPSNDNEPLGTLIRRYPYLYEHCLVSEGSTYEHQQSVRQLQAQIQRQYELDLSQYVTYQVRRSQIARSASPQAANRLLQPIQNPTLLNDRELCLALKQFVGRVEGGQTCRDLAQRFLTHTSHAPSYKSFKDDLYQYIIAGIDSDYGRRKFNEQLYSQLKNTLPDSNNQRLNDFLLVRTCSQLLNFLVVESSQKPQHYIFVDLITNVGATLTTGVLLRIVLICRKVKPYLEKRFSILFNHYESCTRNGVHWLVEAMENLNVALSTNFSTVDLSFINQLT